jgi:nucleotide-binding universal stress UspA family protein
MRVLIALDESPDAERALESLAAWAREGNLEIVLFSVIEPSKVRGTAGNPGFFHSLTPQGDVTGGLVRDAEPRVPAVEDHGQALARARDERTQHLHDLSLRCLPGLDTSIDVGVADDIPGAIVAAARQAGAQLIALPTHARTGLQHVLLGSVGEAVVRLAHLPVVLIGPRAEAQE